MPELPEVEALTAFLRRRLTGSSDASGAGPHAVVAGVEVAAVSVLKTYDPAPTALAGSPVTGVARHGKWIDVDVDGLHLVFHLSRAGWLRWYDTAPSRPARPGRGPLGLRVRFALDDGVGLDGVGKDGDEGVGADDGGSEPGFDLTEAGTRKRLAVHVVRDPRSIPAIATLGPDPLEPAFDADALGRLLAGSRQQVKGLLRDQSVIAGIGNAYSDEILHAARLSPFAIAGRLDDAAVTGLHAAMTSVLADAVAAASGRPAAELKDAKRAGMRVHGRTGQPCGVCRDVVREVSFADRSLQYCPTCQTGGQVLADRRTSRFLR